MLRVRERTLLDMFQRVEVKTEDVTHPERDALLEVPQRRSPDADLRCGQERHP